MNEKIKALLEREGTNISWASLTFNPWIGCQKVSPACDNCYAEGLATTRLGVAWGPGAPRRRTAPGNWGKPVRWNRLSEEAGTRLTVFCASLSDVFDNAVDPEWRADLGRLISATPALDWMLLTKRIGNAEAMLRAMFPGGVPDGVAVGVSVANQAEADRDVPRALDVKNRLRVRRLFLSCEPLLGPVDLRKIILRLDGGPYTDLSNRLGDYVLPLSGAFTDSPTVDLVIAGGESGAGARPVDAEWARALRDQCAEAGVAFHFKQWGEWLPGGQGNPHGADLNRGTTLIEGDGANAVEKAYRVGVKKAGRLLDRAEHLGRLT